MRTILNSPLPPWVLTGSPGSHQFTLPESVPLQEREQQPPAYTLPPNFSRYLDRFDDQMVES